MLIELQSTKARLRDGNRQETTPTELFFDLVYVFAITQISHLVIDADLSRAAIAQAAFILLVVWWAWIYTTWMVNWFDPGSAMVRLIVSGVALASRHRAQIHRVELGAEEFDSAGRWLEADYEIGGTTVTVVSTYVHSGEVDTPKQDEKWKFLDAMTERLPELRAHNPLAVVVGDLNVGHDERDIKNWKGNVKRAGFLPRERAYFSRFFGADGEQVEGADGSTGPGLGWVDVGRAQAGDVDGPYTWWSWRGQAFDNDTGWRIDYQMATPELAGKVTQYTVDRAAAYDQRWSDHAPVVVDYEL